MSGQLVLHSGSFESVRRGFMDYACDGESAKELRAQVNHTILQDREAKVFAPRALHAKRATSTRASRSGIVRGAMTGEPTVPLA